MFLKNNVFQFFGTFLLLIAAAMFVSTSAVQADVTVPVGNSTAPWLAFMNVFELDDSFVFGDVWGTQNNLTATFDDDNNKLTLEAAQVDDPNEFWYQGAGDPGGPGVPGNKNMEANFYQEFNDDPTYSGQTVTFEGNVLAESWANGRTTRAFIRDFASDFSSSNDEFLDLTAPGPFSLSLLTDAGAGRHVQVGFQSYGPNVWPGDEGVEGNIMIGTIPEPTSFGLAGIGALALLGLRRRR
jgi:hypothetical protein